jgi:Clr5 domain
MTYRRIVEEEMEPDPENDDFDSTSSPKQTLPLTHSVLGKRKRTASEDELTTFRRVRLHDRFFAHVPEEEIYPFPHYSPAPDNYLEASGHENCDRGAPILSQAVHFDSRLDRGHAVKLVWDQFEGTIRTLFLEQNLSLKEIRIEMARTYQFNAR